MRQSAENGHLIPICLERLKALVESEFAALALGEPSPLGLLAFFLLNGNTEGKVHRGQATGLGHRFGLGHGVERRQCQCHSGAT